MQNLFLEWKNQKELIKATKKVEPKEEEIVETYDPSILSKTREWKAFRETTYYAKIHI